MYKTKLSFDMGTAYKSAVLLVVFFVPFTALHELGHVLFCSSGNYDIYIFPSGATLCYGTINNPILYHAFGGVLSGMVAVITALSLRKHTFVLITFLSFGIANGFNAVLETFFYNWYATQTNLVNIVGSMFSFGSFIGLLVLFGRRKSK